MKVVLVWLVAGVVAVVVCLTHDSIRTVTADQVHITLVVFEYDFNAEWTVLLAGHKPCFDGGDTAVFDVECHGDTRECAIVGDHVRRSP